MPPIGGRKHLQVGPGHQLGKHAAGLLEQRAPQLRLGGAEALGDAGQVPDRIDRDLDHRHAAVVVHDLAVGRQPSGLRSRRASRRRSSRARVTAMVGRTSRPSAISVAKVSATRCPQGSSETMRCGSLHCGNGPMRRGRMGVGEVGPADRIERARGDRERAIDRIGAAVAADDVAVVEPRHRADHRTACAGRSRAPLDRTRLAAGLRVGGEADVIGAVRRHVRLVLKNRLHPRSGGVTPEVLRNLRGAFADRSTGPRPRKKRI